MFSIELTAKVAWVTGGSRGIGRASAVALARAGCDVAVSYRKSDAEAHDVVAAIQAQGRKGLAVPADVASETACAQAHATIESALGPVQILVNNAGIVADNLFALLSDDDWSTVLNTNIMGVVHCSRLVLKTMMLGRWGRIINLSSAAAAKGGRGQANYAASKGAVEALTRSLAVEVGRRNITVNCLAPGVVETDMSEEVRRLASPEILQRQLIPRFGKPEEIAAWVVFIASPYADFMTGAVVAVDGGLKLP